VADAFGVTGGQIHSAEIHAQKAARRYARKKDQHGRRWGMNVEGPDGRHVGLMELQWPAGTPWPPILPPDQFLKHARRPLPGMDDDFVENYVEVDYPAWKADIRQAWSDFVTRVHEEYAARNIECDWTPDGQVSMRRDVREKVGRDPDAIEPVLACEQGNRWALFGEGKMPHTLAPWFAAKQRIRSGEVLGDRDRVRFDDEPEDEEEMPDAVLAAVAAADAATDLDEEFNPTAAAMARVRKSSAGKHKGGRPKGSRNKPKGSGGGDENE